MNNLQNHKSLNNRYFVMRHGESKANAKRIIISHPENGVKEDFALTELGQKQAEASAKESKLGEQTVIYCSDFSRARETAEIVQKVLNASPIHVTHKLRERYFGDWESSDSANYHKVWDHDLSSASHTNDNVEAINSVLDRATGLIVELEGKYNDKDILLVSHGDTLQILQTSFQGSEPNKHRSLNHLDVAEIRRLELAV